MQLRPVLLSLTTSIFFFTFNSCNPPGKITKETKETTITRFFHDQGVRFDLNLISGPDHNHPSFAAWIETMEGEVIQTLFVTQSLATGYFRFGDAGNGKWLKVPGEASRPAALPYWLHRNELTGKKLPTVTSKLPDAYTGPTPESSAKFRFRTSEYLPDRFRVLVEVNQPWDWNNNWNNDLFPDDIDYRTSAQPSVVYVVTINLKNADKRYFLNPVGHGHYAGKDGTLNTDLSSLTTALRIFDRIFIELLPTE